MSAMTGRLLLFSIAAAGGAAGGVYGQRWWEERQERVAESSESGLELPPRSAVSALGRLEPESEIHDVSAPTGRLMRLDVEEGSVISAGDPLAYLDTHGEMRAMRDHAASQLEEARALLVAETALGAANIEVAAANLRHAEVVLVNHVQAQEAAVRGAEAVLEEAERDLSRASDLVSGNALAVSLRDDAALAARQAVENLAVKRANLEQLRSDQLIQVELAQAQLQAAGAQKSRQELAIQVDSLEQAVRLAEERLERTIVRAPIDGEVLKVLTRPGETVGREPIVKLGDLRSMFAVAEVYETDVNLVEVGQTASISSGAFPELLTGRVERIGKLVYRNDVLAIDPTADSDSRIFEVRIRLDDSGVAARFSNHQVDIEIQLTEDAGSADQDR